MKKVNLMLFLVLTVNSFAQRYDFQMRNALPQLSNPAYVGTAATPRLNYGIMLRNPQLSSSTTLHYLSHDQYVEQLHGGVGLQLVGQSISPNFSSVATALLAYSYQLDITDKLTLAAGVEAGYATERHNYGYFTTNNVDSIVARHFFDYSVGIAGYTEHFYGGVRFSPFNAPSYLSEQTTMRANFWQAHLGYVLTPFTNKDLAFNISSTYTRLNSFQQLGLQVFFNTKRFSVGVNYIESDAVQFFGGVNFWQLMLRLSHEQQLTKLSNSSANSTALTLTYNFKKEPVRKSRAMDITLF